VIFGPEGKGALLKFSYDVERAVDSVVLCTGETVHVVVGRDMKRRRMPETYAQVFRGMVDGSHSL